MPSNNVGWVKYKDMGGPRFLGTVEFAPAKPWDFWTKIVGVVARCEGKHDTVVMYDETGVTAGFLQWTFKSGRLQRLLQSFKAVPEIIDGQETGKTVFESACESHNELQRFADFGFIIKNGSFVLWPSSWQLNPSIENERRLIVDACMGRRTLLGAKSQRQFALDLCGLFVQIFQNEAVQKASVDFARTEFSLALDYERKVLKKYGIRTIRDLLPSACFESPIPAIFFNLFQNLPGRAFTFFSNALKVAEKRGLVQNTSASGYEMMDDHWVLDLLDLIWKRLNQTDIADWGFKSKQYVASKGKNPPRIVRIAPAIKEFYGLDLPFFKEMQHG